MLTSPDVNAITLVAQDYLKAIWSATEWGGPPLTTKTLADRFQTSQANVSETVRRLAGQGLLHYQPYRPVTLTTTGSAYALTMVRRHRLLETFLVRTLGYGWREVHDEAERLEHAVSDTLIERVDVLLGHPLTDPHGDPIPRADGTVPHPVGARALLGAEPDTYTVLRVSDAEPDTLDRLEGQGIAPGSRVRVVDGPHGSQACNAVGEALDPADLAAVQVRPIDVT